MVLLWMNAAIVVVVGTKLTIVSKILAYCNTSVKFNANNFK